MSHLSEKTLTTYRSTINSLYRNIGLGKTAPIDDGKWIKENFENIMEFIDKMKSDFSKKNNIAILKVWASMFELDDKIISVLDTKMIDLNDLVNSTYSTNKMNEKTLDNWVGVEKLKEKVAYLKAKLPASSSIDTYREYMTLMKYLLLLIHIEIPLRNDLADAKIVSDLPKQQDMKVNYLVVKKTGITLILNNYKTSKDQGQKTIPFPKELSKEINKYVDVIKRMSPHNWFLGKDGEDAPITRPTYTKLINSIFNGDGVKVGSTQIRRAVVSDLYKVEENETSTKQNLANVMGHSTKTAGLVYAKFIPDSKK
jgi:integrase